MELGPIVDAAVAAGARSVLLIVGQPVAWRLGEVVETPFGPATLTYQQTQAWAGEILMPTQNEALEAEGTIETDFRIGPHRGRATVFFGQGAHNIVLHLGL